MNTPYTDEAAGRLFGVAVSMVAARARSKLPPSTASRPPPLCMSVTLLKNVAFVVLTVKFE